METHPSAAPGLFVALSRFTVANGMEPAVRQAFWLMTRWQDEASYREWHASHAYHESHRGIPQGLKLDPKSTELSFLEHVTD